MIKMNNKDLEGKLLEILQNTSFSSIEQYLEFRITADHKAIKQGRKIK